jgi:hypothetical protein
MKSGLLNKKQNSFIWKKDKQEYVKQVLPFFNENEEIRIIASFTYITPNHALLFSLEELKRIAKNNSKIYFIFWDLNILANPYTEKNLSLGRIDKKENYIDGKINELIKIAVSIGFKEGQLKIYRSSEIWKRMITYHERDLFQEFYSLISKLKIVDFKNLKKVSNSIKFPLDLFFSIHLDDLFPEDLNQKIDLFFIEEEKVEIYDLIRKELLRGGHISINRPLFYLIKKFPSLLYRNYVPEWEMDLKDIKNIINNCKLSEQEIKSICRNISLSDKRFFNCQEISLRSKDILSKCFYRYLKLKKENFENSLEIFDKSIVNFDTKEKIKEISQVLKSDIGLEIILLSDGTKNTTEISKILKKSVPTISMYANKLKTSGFIRVLDNGNLKRTLQGININFDLGIKNKIDSS